MRLPHRLGWILAAAGLALAAWGVSGVNAESATRAMATLDARSGSNVTGQVAFWEGPDGVKEVGGRRRQVFLEDSASPVVEDVSEQGPGVQIDTGVESVRLRVQAHVPCPLW